jgi:thioesterase domain-containing protein
VGGELFVGGDGLARGYLGQPELNERSFILSPFDPGSRLYKTGDRVRWRPDGTIEFLGRFDRQIKVRGFRVEPGEIETTLLLHPDVRQCVAVGSPDSTGANQLIAYVVPRRTAEHAGEEWRDFLRRRLPEFMVPAFVVLLSELPLTPTGKVDRLALSAPNQLRLKSAQERLEPADDTERGLQEIWQDVLNVSSIGMRENFFAVGGHSLLAVRLIARIEKLLGRKISMAALFRNPSIEQLALLVRNGSDDAHSGSAIVEIQPHGTCPPLVLVHGIGGGMFWGFNNLSRHLGTSQPVFAFDSRGLKGQSGFESIEEMAEFYVQNLRAFQSEGPYQIGGYCFGGVVAYEMACRLREQGQKVALLALINSVPPNSRYTQPDWTVGLPLKFSQNAMRRIAAACRLPPEKRHAFIRWKINSLLARGQRKLGLQTKVLQGGTAEEWIDLSRVPENERDLWKTHLQALQKYQPRPYPGHVTLFRSPVHLWYCSFDPAYGWHQWALGGVTVKIIPGAHETIMEEPRVKALATELQSCLSSAV